jgi:hypothetical protein
MEQRVRSTSMYHVFQVLLTWPVQRGGSSALCHLQDMHLCITTAFITTLYRMVCSSSVKARRFLSADQAAIMITAIL